MISLWLSFERSPEKAPTQTRHTHMSVPLLGLLSRNRETSTNPRVARMMDGTDHCYTHGGLKGHHAQWDSKLFHYTKHEAPDGDGDQEAPGLAQRVDLPFALAYHFLSSPVGFKGHLPLLDLFFWRLKQMEVTLHKKRTKHTRVPCFRGTRGNCGIHHNLLGCGRTRLACSGESTPFGGSHVLPVAERPNDPFTWGCSSRAMTMAQTMGSIEKGSKVGLKIRAPKVVAFLALILRPAAPNCFLPFRFLKSTSQTNALVFPLPTGCLLKVFAGHFQGCPGLVGHFLLPRDRPLIPRDGYQQLIKHQ